MVCVSSLDWNVGFVTCIPVTGTAAISTMDLIDDKWCVTRETRFAPPPKRRVAVSNMLEDGTRFPAEVYDNRVIELRLTCEGVDADDVAAEVQRLVRQLVRPNTLRVQSATTQEVYFRTFAVTPDDVRQVLREQKIAAVSVDVPAYPFAFGPEVTGGPFLVSANPAVTGAPEVVGRGNYFDVTKVIGDVEAPVRIIAPGLGNAAQYTFATRRRGDPDLVPYLLQAEDPIMDMETDTSRQPNDPDFSGYVGENHVRTTYATNAGLVRRFSAFSYPDLIDPRGAGQPEYRGRYRVFWRGRHTSNATLNFQLQFGGRDLGTTPIKNHVEKVTTTGAFILVDLGEIQFPLGLDVPFDGPSGCEQGAIGMSLGVAIERESGTGSTDSDYLIFVPADERFLSLIIGNEVFPEEYILDSFNDRVYGRSDFELDGVWDVEGSADNIALGLIPQVIPHEINRIFFLDPSGGGGSDDNFPDEFMISYWPSYLSLRGEMT